MTAPALLLTAPEGLTDDAATLLRELRANLAEFRPDLQTRHCVRGDGEPSARAAVASLAKRGAHEIVLVPLSAARLSGPDEAELATVRALGERFGLPVSMAGGLQATGRLFSLADRRLHAALQANRVRELDGLVMVHDGDGGRLDTEILERRARIWGTRHRLPHRIVPQQGVEAGALAEALAGHVARGRRHIGIANLSVLASPDLEVLPAPLLTAVAAVGAPLGPDPAVVTEILTQYSVASLMALSETAAS